MGRIRFRRGSRRASAVALCALAGLAASGGGPPLRDAPVTWHADDRRDIPAPEPRDPNIIRSGAEASIFRPLDRMLNPARLVRGLGGIAGGDHVAPAVNVNTLDEVPNSAWFTNRIGLFPMDPETAARGPLTVAGPDVSTSWTVVGAKTEGVTPGFTIEDGRGDTYFIKFDPPGYLGMASAAGVISGRIFHTAGYNVPEDFVVTFARERLVLADDVDFTDPDGNERIMTAADLDSVLARVDRLPDGSWRALASRLLGGNWMGPFDWKGRRQDDPNDRVNHEDRRELRGLRILSAWLCHYDTKQGNTLDMYVEEDGRRFIRHYLIDFASSLGAGALGPYPMACHEYTLDLVRILARAVALGTQQDVWRRLDPPEGLEEVGYFESERFEPMAFKPLEPNTAFANLTKRDAYWAAKIITAFTDRHLETIVAEGHYPRPEVARYITRILGERRDRIGRFFFDRVVPLDFFTHAEGIMRFHDLGAERGVYPGQTARYRYRVAAVTPERQPAGRTQWLETAERAIDLDAAGGPTVGTASLGDHPFLEIELQVDRGEGWSSSVVVYLARASGRVVAVER
jgi:hypothetical protein